MENLDINEVLNNRFSLPVSTTEPNTKYEIIYIGNRADDMLNVVSIQTTQNFICYSWRQVNPKNGESVYLGTGESLEEALIFKSFEKVIKPIEGSSAGLITSAAIAAVSNLQALKTD